MVNWTEADGRSRSEWGTLEDISATGACLHLEQSFAADASVTLLYPKGKYEGKVKYCISQQFGYLLGIEFDPGYRWSQLDFQPAHAPGLRRLHSKKVAPALHLLDISKAG